MPQVKGFMKSNEVGISVKTGKSSNYITRILE